MSARVHGCSRRDALVSVQTKGLVRAYAFFTVGVDGKNASADKNASVG
jgi:hypothetical protein